ncbi:hypothetical protein ABVT39_022258 [Epinephelus coioides]
MEEEWKKGEGGENRRKIGQWRRGGSFKKKMEKEERNKRRRVKRLSAHKPDRLHSSDACLQSRAVIQLHAGGVGDLGAATEQDKDVGCVAQLDAKPQSFQLKLESRNTREFPRNPCAER